MIKSRSVSIFFLACVNFTLSFASTAIADQKVPLSWAYEVNRSRTNMGKVDVIFKFASLTSVRDKLKFDMTVYNKGLDNNYVCVYIWHKQIFKTC
jgi:hypothetical protein